ncbi:MAG: hypothetical protein GF392_02640 [Candidatus Omnitrophica bacterium]|nr:hypothetical protein [Candidatus Omnitrophota bacterium]
MRNFFKVLFLLIILTAVASTAAFHIYEDQIREYARSGLVRHLAESTGSPVTIKETGFRFPNTVTLDRFTIFSRDTESRPLFHAKSLDISIDPRSLLLNKRLITTIRIHGGEFQDVRFDTDIKTFSRSPGSLNNIFSLSLLERIWILGTTLDAEHIPLSDIFGLIELDDLSLDHCRLHTAFNDRSFLITASPEKKENSYLLNIRSPYLGIRSAFEINEKSVIFDTIEGMYYIFRFDLTGELLDPFTPDRYLTLNGNSRADLAALAVLPPPFGTFAGKQPVRGKLDILLNLTASGPDLRDLNVNATLSGRALSIGNFVIDEIQTKLSSSQGRLSAPLINGSIYDGTLTARLDMDLAVDGIPYMVKGVINNMDLYRLMKDLTGNRESISGTVNADLSLKGYLDSEETAEGHGSVTISGADLGPMPLLTPILSDVYLFLEKNVPSVDSLSITGAYMDFDIRDREIITDDFTLTAEDLSIIGEGTLDLDGNLDLYFHHQLREQDTSEERDTWQTGLRNAIINAGRIIKHTRLRGTLREPEWGI